MAVLDSLPKYVRFEVRPNPSGDPDEFIVRFWTESKSDGADVAVWFDVTANESITATTEGWTAYHMAELETAWTDQGYVWTF